MLIISKPLSWYLSYRLTRFGFSIRQGLHHDAQKSIIVTFPLILFRSNKIPFELGPEKAGTFSPIFTNSVTEIFVAKYDMKHQQGLDAHRDGSEFSFIIALNDDFSGGGTYFVDTKKHISLEKGDCLVFSGQNKHKGVKIQSGTRYIIAGFLHFKSCDYCANVLYNDTYCKGKK